MSILLPCALAVRVVIISLHSFLGSSRKAMAETACEAPFLALLLGLARAAKMQFLIMVLVSAGSFSQTPLREGSYFAFFDMIRLIRLYS